MAATVAYVGSQGRNQFLRSIANRTIGVQTNGAAAGTRRDAQAPVAEVGDAGRGAEVTRDVGEERRERVVEHGEARRTRDRLPEDAPHTRGAEGPADNFGGGGQCQARRPVTVWLTMCAIVSTMASRLTPRPSNSKW